MVCFGGGKTLSGAAPGATHKQKGDRGSAPSGDKATSPPGGQPAQSTERNDKLQPGRSGRSSRTGPQERRCSSCDCRRGAWDFCPLGSPARRATVTGPSACGDRSIREPFLVTTSQPS